MANIITEARKKFMARRDKHGLKMGLGLTRLGKKFKIIDYKKKKK